MSSATTEIPQTGMAAVRRAIRSTAATELYRPGSSAMTGGTTVTIGEVAATVARESSAAMELSKDMSSVTTAIVRAVMDAMLRASRNTAVTELPQAASSATMAGITATTGERAPVHARASLAVTELLKPMNSATTATRPAVTDAVLPANPSIAAMASSRQMSSATTAGITVTRGAYAPAVARKYRAATVPSRLTSSAMTGIPSTATDAVRVAGRSIAAMASFRPRAANSATTVGTMDTTGEHAQVVARLSRAAMAQSRVTNNATTGTLPTVMAAAVTAR